MMWFGGSPAPTEWESRNLSANHKYGMMSELSQREDKIRGHARRRTLQVTKEGQVGASVTAVNHLMIV